MAHLMLHQSNGEEKYQLQLNYKGDNIGEIDTFHYQVKPRNNRSINIYAMYRKQLEIQLLLEAIHTLSGFDFRKYNQQSILRRIEHRMRLSNIPTISRLTEAIIYDPELLTKLLNDFSINVTEMFRDPSFFKAFRQHVVPQFQKLTGTIQYTGKKHKCHILLKACQNILFTKSSAVSAFNNLQDLI